MENQKRTDGEMSGAAVTGGPAKRGTSGRGGGEGSGAGATDEFLKKGVGKGKADKRKKAQEF